MCAHVVLSLPLLVIFSSFSFSTENFCADVQSMSQLLERRHGPNRHPQMPCDQNSSHLIVGNDHWRVWTYFRPGAYGIIPTHKSDTQPSTHTKKILGDTSASSHMSKTLHYVNLDSKLVLGVSVNGFLCISPATDCWSVQGVPLNSGTGSSPPCDPELNKQLRRWMEKQQGYTHRRLN